MDQDIRVPYTYEGQYCTQITASYLQFVQRTGLFDSILLVSGLSIVLLVALALAGVVVEPAQAAQRRDVLTLNMYSRVRHFFLFSSTCFIKF